MQSIADLGMGERLRDLARQITLDVHGALSGVIVNSSISAPAMRQHVLGLVNEPLWKGHSKEARLLGPP